MLDQMDSLSLPYLTFSANLELLSLNQAARYIFGSPPGTTTSAAWIFERDGSVGYSKVELRTKLARLIPEGEPGERWGRGLSLEYWVGEVGTSNRKAMRAEAVVQPLVPTFTGSTWGQMTMNGPMTPPSPDFLPGTAYPLSPVGLLDTHSFAVTFLRRLTPHTVSTSPYPSSSLQSSPNLVSRIVPTRISPTPSVNSSKESESNPFFTAPVIDEVEVYRRELISESTAIGGWFDGVALGDGVDSDRHLDFRCIVDHLPQICMTATNEGTVTWFNKSFYEYTGLSQQESFDVHNWVKCFHTDDQEVATARWVHATKTRTPYDVEYRLRGADGIWRWMVAKGRHIPSSDSWICTITEVEELVRVRADALKVKEHITSVLTGADIVLFIVDRTNTVTFFEGSSLVAGPSLRSRKGMALVGQQLTDVWPDARLEAAVSQILAPSTKTVPMLTEINSVQLADKHSYRYRLVPLRGGGGAFDDVVTGVTIVAADVSKLAAAEEALHQSHLERSHLMASENAAKEASRLKTEFVTNISHEIRTPIATVIGICELLLDDPTLMDSHRSLVEKSLRSGQILLDLVGMVLDYGKVEAGKLCLENAPFHLREAVADTELFAVIARKKGVKFEVDDKDTTFTGKVIGDRLRLWQVIANGESNISFLSNAVKFTRHGTITVRVSQYAETPTQCVFLFMISDTGIGIDPAVIPTLFTPFRQADTSTARRYGGSGLGLVLAKSLVELMGGTIKLDSIHGRGTTMTVLIPFEKALVDESISSPEASPELPLPSPKGEEVQLDWPRREDVRILLAEDNDLIREIVTRTLQKMKFSVTAVEDGNAALRAIEERDFDLILMDGQMPGLDGYEATRKIRQLSSPCKRKVKIIALTASAVSGDRERCISAGMDGYLAKPVRARVLEAAIWEQLVGKVQATTW